MHSFFTNFSGAKYELLQVDAAEEVEVDIDQLSTDILWKLERYASNVLQASRRKASLKPLTSAEPAEALDRHYGVDMTDRRDRQPATQSSSTSSSGTVLS